MIASRAAAMTVDISKLANVRAERALGSTTARDAPVAKARASERKGCVVTSARHTAGSIMTGAAGRSAR